MATFEDVPAEGMNARVEAPAAVAAAHSHRDPWLRAAALAGVLALPLALAAGMLSDLAGNAGLNPGSSDAQMLGAYQEYRDKTLVAASLAATAAATTWVFLGALWARLRTGSEWLAVVSVVGGAAAGTLWMAASGMSLVSVVAADYVDVNAERLLMVAGWQIARLAAAPYLVMAAAATVAGFRYRVFGRGFNAFGLVFTILLTFALLPVEGPAGLLAMLGMVWVLVAGLVLAFSRGEDYMTAAGV